ncbi:hypothetical protein OSG_eHP8_00150 [environmental Halophage eHP-8]|nr:hypothetical protein OSG_eHP8_00150 [environmental Halophage eHP-8]AFH21955.1 hypothetical protein OSG_eHP13_00155 [environmental Halophage eHP-13]
MSKEVIVKSRVYKTDCYHTEACANAERLRKQKRMSKAKAQELGLHECLLCRGESITQERTRDSLRYAISRGEVDVDSD